LSFLFTQFGEHEPVELELRFNIVTAAYGRVIGDRVFIMTDDPQVAKAVDVLPKARDLSSKR